VQSKSIEAVRSLVALGEGVTILSDLVYRPWSLQGNRISRRDLSVAMPDGCRRALVSNRCHVDASEGAARVLRVMETLSLASGTAYAALKPC
jgi:DNA-binding transcriptional LysR family regulator